jgi:hypothetical protein
MKRTNLSILFALAIIICTSMPSVSSAQEKPGYDDTPFLPDSPWRVHDKERPQAPVVVPGEEPGAPPEDAVILFDGTDLSAWASGNEDGIEDGAINIIATGGLATKESFGDCQLHIEWKTPAVADGNSMNWGNSGVFFHDQYELQVIESHDSLIYADGIAGAIYAQTPPLANASRKPGEWQTFDAIFLAPRMEDDEVVEPARMTVFWNSVLVQYHQEIFGDTEHKQAQEYRAPRAEGPITLQQHGSAVRYRNIWVRRINTTRPGDED